MTTLEDRNKKLEELKRQRSEIDEQIKGLLRLDVRTDSGKAIISYHQGGWKVSLKTTVVGFGGDSKLLGKERLNPIIYALRREDAFNEIPVIINELQELMKKIIENGGVLK